AAGPERKVSSQVGCQRKDPRRAHRASQERLRYPARAVAPRPTSRPARKSLGRITRLGPRDPRENRISDLEWPAQAQRSGSQPGPVGALCAGSLVSATADWGRARRPKLMTATQSSKETELQGSPDRFGYEWATYSTILPESRGQLERWLGSTTLES